MDGLNVNPLISYLGDIQNSRQLYKSYYLIVIVIVISFRFRSFATYRWCHPCFRCKLFCHSFKNYSIRQLVYVINLQHVVVLAQDCIGVAIFQAVHMLTAKSSLKLNLFTGIYHAWNCKLRVFQLNLHFRHVVLIYSTQIKHFWAFTPLIWLFGSLKQWSSKCLAFCNTFKFFVS